MIKKSARINLLWGLRFFLISYMFFLPLSGLLAETGPVIIDQNFSSLDIGRYTEYYVDKTNSLKVEDVEKIPDSEWQTAPNGRMNFWESPYTYWIRFSLKKTVEENQRMIIFNDYAPVDNLLFYQKQNDKSFQVQVRGDHHVDREKIGSSWYPVFKFNLDGKQVQKYYIQLSSAGNSLWLPLKLFTEVAYDEYFVLRTLFFGLVLGVLVALICYNIFLFILIKDWSYILYITAHLGGIIFLVTNIGYISFIDYPLEWWDKYFLAVVCWSNLFYAPFAVKLFHLKKTSRFFYWLNMIIFYTGTIVLVLNFLAGNQMIFNVILNQLIAFMHPVLLVMTFYLLFKKSKIAYYFTPAIIVINIGFMTRMMAVFSKVDFTFFNLYSFYGAQAIEAILFSLALGNRYNLLKLEKENAQTEAIQNLKKSDEVKNRFLANTSHELRTPLVAFRIFRTFRGLCLLTEINYAV